nr:unnamed protein product [Callosobruchus analis]
MSGKIYFVETVPEPFFFSNHINLNTFQIFDLTETESDWLARHLGHDIRVHREFYRLHESTVELTKVSKLLIAVDAGKVSNFAGKPLKEINVDDLPQVEDNEYESEDETEIEDKRKSLSTNWFAAETSEDVQPKKHF